LGHCQTIKNQSELNRLLHIENLTTGFRSGSGSSVKLHSGIHASLYGNELTAILGPNGAGKSTLLKTLLGFNRKLDGKIFYESQELEEISVRRLAQKVSVVLTEKPDDIYLTVNDIILTGRYPFRSLTGKMNKNHLESSNRAAATTGVTAFMERKFATLSDGEKQRVMIARALAQDTPLIFLDEPTAFIDSPGKVEIMMLMKKIAGTGKGILMTIHDVELALHYADNLWLLGKNDYFETGKPGTLVTSGKINKIFDNDRIIYDPESGKFIEKEDKVI
jgi:iron complex transport system ATP-binding protein